MDPRKIKQGASSSSLKDKRAWYTKKIEYLETQNRRLQKDNDALVKERNALKRHMNRVQAEKEEAKELMDARTQEVQASRTLQHVTDTVSEADVVESADRLNDVLHQTAALIVDSFNSSLEKRVCNLHQWREDVDKLVSFQATESYTIKIQNVLQNYLGKWCAETLGSWTFNNSMLNLDQFLDSVVQSLKAGEPLLVNTWVRLTRTYCKLPAYRDTKQIGWSSQVLAEITAGVLCAAGVFSSTAEAERVIQEKFMDSFRQIFQHCFNLEKAILGRASADIQVHFPQGGVMFDPETMQILGEDQMATIAFTRELGLQARSGDSTSRTILKAGVIPDSSIAMLEDSDMEVLETSWGKV
ncbi:hypothetical protein BT96DRAFT_75431 [Gymnopus androsaceus JB14]|uniref:Uncharacterized protein n=1 Tax=Gymnopus androsaceus JB14 TaxID=1447944 RepID=A0A6A4HIL6_9AGAR|nr:hypothetical protein BT96DRAFT_75431 [Gymnopus androsaceus JB14]